MYILLQIIFVFLCVPVWAYDASDYRQNTYGAPNSYCDLTLPVSPDAGDGSLGNPWNPSRCMSQPTAPTVVGILPGVSSILTSKQGQTGGGSIQYPAFEPANSGTFSAGTCTAKIVYVTKYAASAMDPATVGTNANRTQFRHDGTSDANDVAGTGGPVLGARHKDCIVFDGFYIDVASALPSEDSGVLACRGTDGGAAASGIEWRNYQIKGTVLTINSNAVVYRPNHCLNTVHKNFIVKDFVNKCGAGCSLAQAAYFSDSYGDRNSLLENFTLDGVDNGPFLKGSADGNTYFNYGTIRYGIIKNTRYSTTFGERSSGICLGVHALDATNLTTVHNVLCYNYQMQGFGILGLTINARNVLYHHLTAAKGCADLGCGAFYVEQFDTTAYSNVTERDSIFDMTAGSQRYYTDATDVSITLPPIDYNGYYSSGGVDRWGYNGGTYNPLSAWQAVSGTPDVHSTVLATNPFVNYASNDYHISGGHAAKTASSTGGEIGAYGDLGTNVLGVDTTPDSVVTPSCRGRLMMLRIGTC